MAVEEEGEEEEEGVEAEDDDRDCGFQSHSLCEKVQFQTADYQ